MFKEIVLDSKSIFRHKETDHDHLISIMNKYLSPSFIIIFNNPESIPNLETIDILQYKNNIFIIELMFVKVC